MSSGRRIESRVDYGNGLVDEWGPADHETDREFSRAVYTEKDARDFVRAWNKAAKARGDNTRVRSVQDENEW